MGSDNISGGVSFHSVILQHIEGSVHMGATVAAKCNLPTHGVGTADIIIIGPLFQGSKVLQHHETEFKTQNDSDQKRGLPFSKVASGVVH